MDDMYKLQKGEEKRREEKKTPDCILQRPDVRTRHLTTETVEATQKLAHVAGLEGDGREKVAYAVKPEGMAIGAAGGRG